MTRWPRRPWRGMARRARALLRPTPASRAGRRTRRAQGSESERRPGQLGWGAGEIPLAVWVPEISPPRQRANAERADLFYRERRARPPLPASCCWCAPSSPGPGSVGCARHATAKCRCDPCEAPRASRFAVSVRGSGALKKSCHDTRGWPGAMCARDAHDCVLPLACYCKHIVYGGKSRFSYAN